MTDHRRFCGPLVLFTLLAVSADCTFRGPIPTTGSGTVMGALSIVNRASFDCGISQNKTPKPMGVLIRYVDPKSRAERVIYEVGLKQFKEGGEPVFIPERVNNWTSEKAPAPVTLTVRALTSDKQLRVIRTIKAVSPTSTWDVETIVENLTGGPLELISIENACVCGPECPLGCRECHPASVNGKELKVDGETLISFGASAEREILKADQRSLPAKYKVAAP